MAEAEKTEKVQEEAKKEAEVEKKAKRVKKVQKKEEIGSEEQLLFGKYSTKDVVVEDISLANYIVLTPKENLNSFGRRKDKAHFVTKANIVERLINKMMRGGTGQKIGGRVIRTEGRLQGKKLKLMRIVEEAFDDVAKKTGKNPVQVLVDAIQNSAPIEDTTRIRYGGINYNVAVGISAARRLDVALRNIALAALTNAFQSRKTLKEALSEELILAANNDPNSYAIKKKIEIERIARSAR
jgi:small subunit ribosomal protein S7